MDFPTRKRLKIHLEEGVLGGQMRNSKNSICQDSAQMDFPTRKRLKIHLEEGVLGGQMRN